MGGVRLLAYFAFGSLVGLLNLEKYLKLEISLMLIIAMYFFPEPCSHVFMFFVVAYSILSFGNAPIFYPRLIIKNDIAYELFIWAFPCQQMVLMMRDELALKLLNDTTALYALSMAFAILVSFLCRKSLAIISVA